MIEQDLTYNSRETLIVNPDNLDIDEVAILDKLAITLDIELDSEFGIDLKTKKNDEGKISVIYDAVEDSFKLSYFDKRSFARALSHLRAARKTGVLIEDKLQFEDLGFMLDVSRNAVLTVDSVKEFVNYLAAMGYNCLFLYMEDTYRMPEYPYFGYQRGAYTKAELKEIDRYAASLGIEVIPCIQTLAHLSNALRWHYADKMKDTDDILLVGSDDTYRFIDSMFSTISQCFSSKRIHLGMDEAAQLGRGRYLEMHGLEDRFEVFSKHMKTVYELCDKYGLKPMLWSDTYVRAISKNHDYNDLETPITEEHKENIKNVGLVYWDYYNEDKDQYKGMLKRHIELAGVDNTWFAGGLWNWNGLKVNHGKMFRVGKLALEACKEEGIKHVMTTAWSDNGAETNVFEALLGAQFWAESSYTDLTPSRKETIERFNETTGSDGQAYYNMRFFDEVPGTSLDNSETVNPSKYILWSDPLVGLFDAHILPLADELIAHYMDLADYFDFKALETDDQNRLFYLQSAQLADCLYRKVDLTKKLRSSYLSNNLDVLYELVDKDIPELIAAVKDLQAFSLSIWYLSNKPQGSEIIDARYGALLTRLSTTLDRVDGYLNGIYESLPELEERRLPYDGRSLQAVESDPHIRENLWHRIISSNPM